MIFVELIFSVQSYQKEIISGEMKQILVNIIIEFIDNFWHSVFELSLTRGSYTMY